MGRYDGPDFECEEKDVVSIWAAKCPSNEIPKNYFTENYDADDDMPFNQFSKDFGFGYYDHDFVEPMALGECSSIEEILSCCSYGKSFARSAAVSTDLKKTEHVFLMYNFEYDPAVTKIWESKYYRFVGVFKFERYA